MVMVYANAFVVADTNMTVFQPPEASNGGVLYDSVQLEGLTYLEE